MLLLAAAQAFIFAIPALLVVWYLAWLAVCSPTIGSSKPVRDTIEPDRRGVAQPGSASALGAEGRGFESLRPDHLTSSLSTGLTES